MKRETQSITLHNIDGDMLRKQTANLVRMLGKTKPSEHGNGSLWGVVNLLNYIQDKLDEQE